MSFTVVRLYPSSGQPSSDRLRAATFAVVALTTPHLLKWDSIWTSEGCLTTATYVDHPLPLGLNFQCQLGCRRVENGEGNSVTTSPSHFTSPSCCCRLILLYNVKIVIIDILLVCFIPGTFIENLKLIFTKRL